jgi:hypothetical protein
MAQKCIGINLIIFLISVCFNAHAQELSYNKLITMRLVDKVYTHSWVKNSFRTSPDNRRVAFVVEDGAKSFVDIDGIEGNRYEKIKVDSLGFSPDCKHIAYAARNVRWFMVVDGKEGKGYDEILDGTPHFSQDGRHLVFVARSGDKWWVVIDGKEDTQYDAKVDIEVGSLAFDNPDRFHYLFVRDQNIYSVNEKIY